MSTDRITDLTLLNIVIHLRKVKQSALPFTVTFCTAEPAVLVSPQYTLSLLRRCRAEASETFFSHRCSNFETNRDARQVHVFQVWSSCFLWFLGEVKHIVHLIRRNLNSRLCPCGLIDHGPVLGATRDYLGVS